MDALKRDSEETLDQQQEQNNENQEDLNYLIQHPVKKKLQDHINQLSSKMKYKNKIDEIISGLQLFNSIEQMFRIIDKELLGCLFTQIINCMLDMRWTKQKDRKTNLIIESIKNSLKYIDETDNFFHIFQYLLQTRIWSEADEFVEILLRNASDNTDVLTDEDIAFLSKERMFVIILRLQSLYESNLIESAFFVCRKAKLCLQTLDNEHTLIKTTSIQQRNLITDLYFCCLAELNRKKLVSEINSMNSDELYKLIIRNSNLNKDGTKFAESRNQLLEISTKYFVAKVTLKPIDEFDDKTIEKFSNVWEILIQQHLDDNSNIIKIFFDKVFEKAQPKHIVVACDVMRKFNNPEWKSLLWEKVFSIITTKLNKLEKMKYSYPVNVESVIKYEKALVFYYKIFSNFLKDSSKHLYRECLLTLYSLCPCYELANLVDNEIFDILLIKSKNLKNFLTINNDNDNNVKNDEISNIELITKDELLELATFFESELIPEDYILETIDYADDLPTDTIDDVIMVIMSPRLKLLTWSLNAENLKCIMKKLLEPGQKRLYIERNLADANDKLTHVKVDARDYSHLPLCLEFPGIEKGYEEFETDSDEQQYDDDDYNNNHNNNNNNNNNTNNNNNNNNNNNTNNNNNNNDNIINNGLNEIQNDSQDSDNNINFKRKRKYNKNLTSINNSTNNDNNNNNGIKRGRGNYTRRKQTIIRGQQLLRLNKNFINQNQKENLNLSLNENNKNSDNSNEIPILQNINDFDKKLNNSNKNNNTNNSSALHRTGGRRVTRLNSVRLENFNHLMNLPNPSKISNRAKKLRDKQQQENDSVQILHDEELKSIKLDIQNDTKISDDLLASSHQKPKSDEDSIINTLFSALNDAVTTKTKNNLSNNLPNAIDSNDKNLQLLEKENVQPEPTTIEIFDRINEFIETELFGLPSISEEVIIQSDFFKLNSNKNDTIDCDINLFNSSSVPKEISRDFNTSLQTSVLAESELTIQPVTKTYTRPRKQNQQQLEQKSEIININSEILAIPGTSKQEICYYPEEPEEDIDLSTDIQKPINDDVVMKNEPIDNQNNIYNEKIVEQNNNGELQSLNNSSSKNESSHKTNNDDNYKEIENISTIIVPSSTEIVEIESFNKDIMLSINADNINETSDHQNSENCLNSSYISDDDSTCAQISDNGIEDYDNDHGGINSIFSLTESSCQIDNIDSDFKSSNVNNLNNITEYQFDNQTKTHDTYLNNEVNYVNSDNITYENTENITNKNDDNSEIVDADNINETSSIDNKLKKHVTWNLDTTLELNNCENENPRIINFSDPNDNLISNNNIVHTNINNENCNNNLNENQLILDEENNSNANVQKNNVNNIILEENMELELPKTILKRKYMSNLISSVVLDSEDFNKRQKTNIIDNQLTKSDDDTTVNDTQSGGDINRVCDNDDDKSNVDEEQPNTENKKLKKLVITGIKTHQLSLVYDSSTSSSFDNTIQNLTSLLPNNNNNKNTENCEYNNIDSLSLRKELKINLDRASFDILLKNKVNVMIDNYLVQHPIVRLSKLEDSIFLKKYKKNKCRQNNKQQYIEFSEESNKQDKNLQLLDKINDFKELKLTSVKSINLQLPGILPQPNNNDSLNLLSNIHWKKHFDNNIIKKINLNNEIKTKTKTSLSSKILTKSLFKKKKNRSDMKNVLKFLNEKMASKLNYINRQQNDDLYMSSSSNTSNTSNESLDYSTTYNNNSRVLNKLNSKLKKRIRSRRTTTTTTTIVNNNHRDIIFNSNNDVHINFEDDNYDNSIFNSNHNQINDENDNNYNSSASSSSSVSGPIPTICKIATNNNQQQQRIKKFYNKRKNYNENFIDMNNGYKKYYDTNAASNKMKMKLSNKKQKNELIKIFKNETVTNKQLKETNDYILTKKINITKNTSILSPMMVIKRRQSASVQQKFIDNKKQINELRKIQQNDPFYLEYQKSFQDEKKQHPRQLNYKVNKQQTGTISLDYIPESQKRRRNTTNAPKYCELSPPSSPTTLKRQQFFLLNKPNKYSSSSSITNNKVKQQLTTKKIEEIDSNINLSDSEIDFENSSEDPLLPTTSFVYVDNINNISFETKNCNKYLKNDNFKLIDNEYVNKNNDNNIIPSSSSSNQLNNNVDNDLKLNTIKIDDLQKMLPPIKTNIDCRNIQNQNNNEQRHNNCNQKSQKRSFINTTVAATTTTKTTTNKIKYHNHHQNQHHNHFSGNKGNRIMEDINLFISDESDHEKFSSDSEYKPSTKIKNIPPKRYNNEAELRPSKYRNEFTIYSVLVNINNNDNNNNININTNTRIVNIFKEFYSKNNLYNNNNIKNIDYNNINFKNNDDINFTKSSKYKYNNENLKINNIIKKLYYFGIMEYDNLLSFNNGNKDNYYKYSNAYYNKNNSNYNNKNDFDNNDKEYYNNIISNINSKMKIYKTILNKKIKYLNSNNNYQSNKFPLLLNSSNLNDNTNDNIKISNYDIKINNNIMNNLNYKNNKNKFFNNDINNNIKSFKKIAHKIILFEHIKFYIIINKNEYNLNNNNNCNNIKSIININRNTLIKNIINMNILNKIFYNIINKILINNWLKNFKCRRKILIEYLTKLKIYKLVSINYYENNYNENNYNENNIKIFLFFLLYHYNYNQILIKIINLIDIIYITYNFLFL